MLERSGAGDLISDALPQELIFTVNSFSGNLPPSRWTSPHQRQVVGQYYTMGSWTSQGHWDRKPYGLRVGQVQVGTTGLQRVHGPVPAVGGLQHHLGALASPGNHDANRCTSLTIRTASRTSPLAVVRTITVRRRRRSIPTCCFPAYASIWGLLALLVRDLDTPKHPAGRRRWEREEAPLLHHIKGSFSTWWQVKDSDLRSFRETAFLQRRQACDQRQCRSARQLPCVFPTDSEPPPTTAGHPSEHYALRVCLGHSVEAGGS